MRWHAKGADGVEVTIDAEPHGTDAPDAPVEVVGYIAALTPLIGANLERGGRFGLTAVRGCDIYRFPLIDSPL